MIYQKQYKDINNPNNIACNSIRFIIFYAIRNLFCITFFILLSLNNAYSKCTIVDSVPALQTYINAASAGDTILLKNGTYTNNTISIPGAKNHLTIMPVTNGGVFLNGTNNIRITGNYNTFNGFQFTSGYTPGNVITIYGNYNILSQLNFNGYNATHMLMIEGYYNLIVNCNFQNKPATNMVTSGGTGDMVQIIPDTLNTPGYNVIRYCSFQHMPGVGGDYGNEGIRIGDSPYAKNISRTTVEYCYFEDTGLGDNEAISVKSQENCLRYNTMKNNPLAMFTFRNGDNNVAYGNFFIQSGGIRIKQANNIYCYNNYFENASSYPPVHLEYYDNTCGNNFNLIHNTFYSCSPIQIDTGMKTCTWANNIFYWDSATIISGSINGQSFMGNLYQGTIGYTITSGMTNTNPLLSLNACGFYAISSGSPAINAAVAGYPSILDITNLNDDPTLTFDIQGQSRPYSTTLKDVGCDEYKIGPVINHPLQLCETGPFYLCSTCSCVTY